MRIIITTLMILIWTISYGQFEKYKGTWISDSQDVMIINDTIKAFNVSNKLCDGNRRIEGGFQLLGDTLRFLYYYSTTDFNQSYIDSYDLIVSELTDTSITITPSSDLSAKFLNERTNIKFIKQEFNRDKSIVFEKIIYHSSKCYWNCPIIDLEITSDKNIYFAGRFYKGIYGFDHAKSGHFTGMLSDSLYNELIDILQTCNLRTLTFPSRSGADAPIVTLIIYYNGQKKCLYSMFPPAITDRLIDFLHHINERVSLTRTNEIMVLEY